MKYKTMKVYICWAPNEKKAADEQLLGIFLLEKDADNFKKQYDSYGHRCVIQPTHIIL